MNKKVVSAVLAASMAVSLAACGSTATSAAEAPLLSLTQLPARRYREAAGSGSYT